MTPTLAHVPASGTAAPVAGFPISHFLLSAQSPEASSSQMLGGEHDSWHACISGERPRPYTRSKNVIIAVSTGV